MKAITLLALLLFTVSLSTKPPDTHEDVMVAIGDAWAPLPSPTLAPTLEMNACSVKDCLCCETIDTCKQCDDGYFITEGSVENPNHHCHKCIDHCDLCSDDKSCYHCEQGYFVADDGKSCQKCGEYCDHCEDENVCERCAHGYRPFRPDGKEDQLYCKCDDEVKIVAEAPVPPTVPAPALEVETKNLENTEATLKQAKQKVVEIKNDVKKSPEEKTKAVEAEKEIDVQMAEVQTKKEDLKKRKEAASTTSITAPEVQTKQLDIAEEKMTKAKKILVDMQNDDTKSPEEKHKAAEGQKMIDVKIAEVKAQKEDLKTKTTATPEVVPGVVPTIVAPEVVPAVVAPEVIPTVIVPEVIAPTPSTAPTISNILGWIGITTQPPIPGTVPKVKVSVPTPAPKTEAQKEKEHKEEKKLEKVAHKIIKKIKTLKPKIEKHPELKPKVHQLKKKLVEVKKKHDDLIEEHKQQKVITPEIIPGVIAPEIIPGVIVPEINPPEVVPTVTIPETVPTVIAPETVPTVIAPETVPAVIAPEAVSTVIAGAPVAVAPASIQVEGTFQGTVTGDLSKGTLVAELEKAQKTAEIQADTIQDIINDFGNTETDATLKETVPKIVVGTELIPEASPIAKIAPASVNEAAESGSMTVTGTDGEQVEMGGDGHDGPSLSTEAEKDKVEVKVPQVEKQELDVTHKNLLDTKKMLKEMKEKEMEKEDKSSEELNNFDNALNDVKEKLTKVKEQKKVVAKKIDAMPTTVVVETPVVTTPTPTFAPKVEEKKLKTIGKNLKQAKEMLELMVDDDQKSPEEKKKLTKAVEKVKTQIQKHKIAEFVLKKKEEHIALTTPPPVPEAFPELVPEEAIPAPEPIKQTEESDSDTVVTGSATEEPEDFVCPACCSAPPNCEKGEPPVLGNTEPDENNCSCCKWTCPVEKKTTPESHEAKTTDAKATDKKATGASVPQLEKTKNKLQTTKQKVKDLKTEVKAVTQQVKTKSDAIANETNPVKVAALTVEKTDLKEKVEKKTAMLQKTNRKAGKLAKKAAQLEKVIQPSIAADIPKPVECHENCLYCDTSDGTCEFCNEGYFIPDGTNECKKCMDNCDFCPDAEACYHCDPGFYVTEDRKSCNKCGKNCRHCENEKECERCEHGYRPWRPEGSDEQYCFTFQEIREKIKAGLKQAELKKKAKNKTKASKSDTKLGQEVKNTKKKAQKDKKNLEKTKAIVEKMERKSNPPKEQIKKAKKVQKKLEERIQKTELQEVDLQEQHEQEEDSSESESSDSSTVEMGGESSDGPALEIETGGESGDGPPPEAESDETSSESSSEESGASAGANIDAKIEIVDQDREVQKKKLTKATHILNKLEQKGRATEKIAKVKNAMKKIKKKIKKDEVIKKDLVQQKDKANNQTVHTIGAPAVAKISAKIDEVNQVLDTDKKDLKKSEEVVEKMKQDGEPAEKIEKAISVEKKLEKKIEKQEEVKKDLVEKKKQVDKPSKVAKVIAKIQKAKQTSQDLEKKLTTQTQKVQKVNDDIANEKDPAKKAVLISEKANLEVEVQNTKVALATDEKEVANLEIHKKKIEVEIQNCPPQDIVGDQNCEVENCLYCDKTDNTCYQCQEGYFIPPETSENSNPNCAKCGDHCDHCVDEHTCDRCEPGYRLFRSEDNDDQLYCVSILSICDGSYGSNQSSSGKISYLKDKALGAVDDARNEFDGAVDDFEDRVSNIVAGTLSKTDKALAEHTAAKNEESRRARY